MRDGITLIDAHLHLYRAIQGDAEGMPPSFTAHDALRLLDSFDVDRALLVQNPTIGIINEEIADAVQTYPQRFAGAVQADPLAPNAVELVRQYAELRGMRALKLEMSEGYGWCGIHPGLTLDCEQIRALLDAVPQRFTIIIDTGPIGSSGYQPDAVERLAQSYPALNFLVEHLGYLTAGDLNDAKKLDTWRRLISLGQMPNMYFGLSASLLLLDDVLPYRRFAKALQAVLDAVGAGKLLWGSDAPGTLEAYAYSNMADSVLRHASFLTEDEKKLMLGGNALRLFW